MNAPLDEHPFNHKGQFLCSVIFLFIWAIDSTFNLTTFFSTIIPLWFRITVLVTTILTVIGIFRSVTLSFPDNKDIDYVLSDGVFKYLRHPLYFACILLYFGLSLSTASLISLFLLIPIFIFYNHISIYEENSLITRLGDPYVAYIQTTRRWIPIRVRK